MWTFFKKYGWSAASFAFAMGFDVSDIHSQFLTYGFWVIGFLLAIPPILAELDRFVIVPVQLNPTPGKMDYDIRMKRIFVGIITVLVVSCGVIAYLYFK